MTTFGPHHRAQRFAHAARLQGGHRHGLPAQKVRAANDLADAEAADLREPRA